MTFIKNNSISIAMATYNGAEFLEDQLMSIVNQTLLPDELVVCDDCSTDATCEIIERFKESAPFAVHFYKNEKNLGYAQNFSKAMSLCKGNFVFLSDQDDVWLPKKIEFVLKVFENEPSAQLVIHDLEFCDVNLKPIGQRKIERIRLVADPMEKYVTGMATAVRSSFLKLCIPIPPMVVSHDMWLHLCAKLLDCKTVIPEVLANYRRHDKNATDGKKMNAAKKIYKSDFLKNRFQMTSFEMLNKDLSRKLLLHSWITKNKNDLIAYGYITGELFEKKIESLNKIIAVLRDRIFILSQPRFGRLNLVAKLYCSNGYKQYGGIKAALKDFLSNAYVFIP